MTALVVVLVLVALAAIAVGIRRAVAHRHALDRERRRREALTSLEDRLRGARAILDMQASTPARDPARAAAPPAPAGSRGRAALLDALTDAVAAARADGSRLSVALVESRETGAAGLAAEVAGVTEQEPYEVGPRAVAVIVRSGGRAEALGLLARIQVACGAAGDAVELERGETAVELLARALSGSRPP